MSMHFIGAKPAALGSLALKLVPAKHIVVHLPDLDPLGSAGGTMSWFYRPSAAKLIASLVRSPASFLLVENPDDLAYLHSTRRRAAVRASPCSAAPASIPTSIRCCRPRRARRRSRHVSARMATSNGIDVLMRAFDRVWARGVHLQLELVGDARGRRRRHSA